MNKYPKKRGKFYVKFYVKPNPLNVVDRSVLADCNYCRIYKRVLNFSGKSKFYPDSAQSEKTFNLIAVFLFQVTSAIIALARREI